MTWGRIIASAFLYGAIIVGIYLHRHPVRIGPPREAEQSAAGFASNTGRAHAALLMSTPRGEARHWSGLPTDAAWGNFLRQEVGVFEVIDPAEIASANLAALALIVLPEGVRPKVGEALHDTLDAWTRRGGILIVDNGALGAYHAPVAGHPVRGRIRGMRPGLVDSLTHRGLFDTPVEWAPTGAGEAAGRDTTGMTSLVEAGTDGGSEARRSLIAAVPRGSGGTVALGFPFARQLLLWQQGLPSDNFSMPVRWRREAGVALRQTNEFVADKAFLTTEFPHADAFERLIMACAETIHPVPRLWYFPAPYDGAYCMSHDDEDFGDRSRGLTEEEARQGYAATMFIIPRRITAAGLTAMRQDGAEIALHWWRGWSASMERPVGLLGWTPVRQNRTLAEQKRILEGLSPGLNVTANRVHGLIWAPHYTRDFRRMEAAGFRLDSSYGPAGPAQLGYLFGTGFPFHPLDTNGLAFALEEMPFLYQDDERWDPGVDERFLAASRDSWHEVLTPLYHTTTMFWNPSVAVMEGFLAAGPRAREANHWLVPMGAYHEFWRTRGATSLRRRGDGAGFDLAAPPDSSLALMVPAGWRVVRAGEAMPGATPDAPVPLRRVNLMGGAYDLVPLGRLGAAFRFERDNGAPR